MTKHKWKSVGKGLVKRNGRNEVREFVVCVNCGYRTMRSRARAGGIPECYIPSPKHRRFFHKVSI